MNLKKLLGSNIMGPRKLVIRSAHDLLKVAEEVNEARRNYDGWTVVLECDVDLGGTAWEPIGNHRERPFCGKFDGKGHTLSGLRLETEGNYAGLFGVVEGAGQMGLAEICNLCLKDFEITARGAGARAGGILGYAGEGVLIENCHTRGSVRSQAIVGGILGMAEGSMAIRDCRIEGVVAGESILGSVAGQMTTDSILRDCQCHVVNGNGYPVQRMVGRFDTSTDTKSPDHDRRRTQKHL